MSEPAKKPNQQPESYQPKKPEIVSMVEGAQEAARERVIKTVDYKGAIVEVVEWPETIWCGKLGWATNNTDEPDVPRLMESFQAIMDTPTNERLALDWDVALFIDHHRNDRPSGTLFGHVVGTERQPKGYDTYRMPAQIFVRMRNFGEDTAQFDLKKDFLPASGYAYDSTAPDFSYYGFFDSEKGAHALQYDYTPVTKMAQKIIRSNEMSDPAKKPGQQPESYQPKKPEIVSMAQEAQGSTIQQTEAQPALERFEIVKCGPYRFIGRSVYSWAWGHLDTFAYLREQSGPIFEILDSMSEYASDDPHNAALRHWEAYGDKCVTQWKALHFGKTELLGYTVGRFMKAGAPVPEGMNYIDIPEMHIARAWMKGTPNDKVGLIDEGLVYDEICRTDRFRDAPWMFAAEIYPVPDENGVPVFGSYVACTELNKKEKAKRQKEREEAETSKKASAILIEALDKLVPSGESEQMEVNKQDDARQKGITTAQSFELPVRISLHTKVDEHHTRLSYGKGWLTFLQGSVNMGDPAEGRPCVFHECAGIPTGESADIEWILDREFLAIRVNGELRHIGNNYGHIREAKNSRKYKLSSPVTVAAAVGSTATVERLRITEI